MIETEEAFLNRVLRGQAAAVELVRQLMRVSQIIDDLHDRDVDVSAARVKTMAWAVLVEVPSNAFYRRYFLDLQPVIRVALADWFDSTVLECGAGEDRTLAFVLRDTLTALVNQCAYLIGGADWMAANGPAVRRFFHDETLSDYLAELPAQTGQEATSGLCNSQCG